MSEMASARVRLAGGTRRGTDSASNEDAFHLFHEHSCAVVLDGAGRAGGAARRGVEQVGRLLRDQPPSSLPDWERMARLLDSSLLGAGKSTLAGFRFLEGRSGFVVCGVVVGDAKLLHVSRDGQVQYVSETRKSFLGSGAADPLGVYLRADRRDMVVAASDGAWAALGGAQKIASELLRLALRVPLEDVPLLLLEKPRVLLDDATLVLGTIESPRRDGFAVYGEASL